MFFCLIKSLSSCKWTEHNSSDANQLVIRKVSNNVFSMHVSENDYSVLHDLNRRIQLSVTVNLDQSFERVFF